MISETIFRQARLTPLAPALIYNGRVISYQLYAEAIAGTIAHLKNLELPHHGVMGIVISNLHECWIATIDLQAVGLDTVCISSLEVLKQLDIPDLIGTTTSESEISEQSGTDETGKPGKRLIVLPLPSSRTNSAFPHFTRDQVSGRHILYTSGTTGLHKKLYYTPEQQAGRDQERIESMTLDGHTHFHCLNFGLWTAVGYAVPPSVWRAGGCVLLEQRQDWPTHFMASQVTRAIMLPEQLHQLLDLVSRPCEGSPAMDFTLHAAGGFISPDLAENILTKLTPSLLVSYGSTEVSIAILESSVINIPDLHWLAPTGFRSIEIIDEQGDPCPVDVEGEVRIRLTSRDL